MNKPVKNPPKAQIEAGETEIADVTVPTLVIETKDNVSAENGRVSEPTLVPPYSATRESAEEGFGAGIWNNDKKVSTLYSTNFARNSWMYIVGTGWVGLDRNIDTANAALTILAASAKIKNSPINYYLDGEVTQIYVW